MTCLERIELEKKKRDKRSTLRVKARPSRPSGNKTVNNFLSSLTTTLKIKITTIINSLQNTTTRGI
jgi:hypothetical protein